MRQIAIAALAAMLLTGCASVHSTTEGLLSGGLLGAGVGIAATAIGGGSIAAGAAVGGIVGAAAGAYVGCRNDKRCN